MASFGFIAIFALSRHNGYILVCHVEDCCLCQCCSGQELFKKSLSREEYYSEGQELVGYWQGYGAERLGLSGRVDQQSFNALADNLKPGTDETLTARMKENRRVGYDFNFNCPKSVSVLYEQERDERIVWRVQILGHANHARS